MQGNQTQYYSAVPWSMRKTTRRLKQVHYYYKHDDILLLNKYQGYDSEQTNQLTGDA
jgi:hypothetical protein